MFLRPLLLSVLFGVASSVCIVFFDGSALFAFFGYLLFGTIAFLSISFFCYFSGLAKTDENQHIEILEAHHDFPESRSLWLVNERK